METTCAHRGERMTPVDAAWMRMDEADNPMMTTGMLLLDGPIDRRRLVRVFRRVLPSHPRFLQRIESRRTGPRWVSDDAFDADEHVKTVRVGAPGDDAALRRLIARLMSSSLVSEGAMWNAHVVDGLAGGRGALIFRLRHAVADGPALLNVMADLTDARPTGHRAGDTASFFGPNGAPAPLPLLGTAGASGPRAVLTAGMQAVGGLAELLRVVIGPPDRDTALRGGLAASKAPGWTDPIALDRFRPIRRVTGATVNDILLSCTAGGIRTYLLEQGEPVDGLELRGMVPVNLTALSAKSDAGNHFGLVYLTLPVGIEDPFARLHATRRHTERIKASGEAPVSYAVLGAIGLLPPEVVAPTLGFFGSRATAVITNVPGPPTKRYLAGRRIEEIVFWVPQAARLGLGISLMSYAGTVMVGIGADAGLVPRPQRLADAIEAEFRALEREVASAAPATARTAARAAA